MDFVSSKKEVEEKKMVVYLKWLLISIRVKAGQGNTPRPLTNTRGIRLSLPHGISSTATVVMF